jgi:phosphonate degradation associated HDIG domain protein
VYRLIVKTVWRTLQLTTNTPGAVDAIRGLFTEKGDSAYGGESVSQLEHALQTAALARRAGVGAALVTAALLHDVGHLLHDLPDDAPDRGVDDTHEALAAGWLSRWFVPDVTEPVRLHVDAKRYLCAVEPEYLRRLSEPSLLSLRLQGGPMTADEVRAFRESPYLADAVALRRWDDEAKDPELAVPGLEFYVPTIEEALAASPAESRCER